MDTTDYKKHVVAYNQIGNTYDEEHDVTKYTIDTDKPSHSAAAQSRKLYHHLLMQYL